jgi:signal transduction histidine kinase/CheY-like chemotaxis protein
MDNIKGHDGSEDGGSSVGSNSTSGMVALHLGSAKLASAAVFCLGLGCACAFWAVGITAAIDDQNSQFASLSNAMIQEMDHLIRDYTNGALWLHQSCRDRTISRQDYRSVYNHLLSVGLGLIAAEFAPNVTHEERPVFEDEAQTYYAANYPNSVEYYGFVGYEPDLNDPELLTIQNRSEQEFYFPAQLIEPVEGNKDRRGFDLFSSDVPREAIVSALTTWKPSITPRLSFHTEPGPSTFGVLLVHPGIPDASQPDLQPRDVSVVAFSVTTIIEAALGLYLEPMSVFIYDTTDDGQVLFLGGVELIEKDEMTFTEGKPETELYELVDADMRLYEETIVVAGRTWLVAFAATDGTFEPRTGFVLLGGVVILIACMCLAVWVFTNADRQNSMNRIKQKAEQDKAAVIIDTAQKAMKAERELNDFIAHEVRNPLAAAMSASSFVQSSVNDETKPFSELRKGVNEDMRIIESALQFINDLLRNMLDMQRAHSKQLNIDLGPVDVFQDVFSPVDAMLYRRGDDLKVEVVCPKDLIVMSDRLRLKQIVLNLGRNSLKFVNKGFIRLRAEIGEDNVVTLYVEDSGPGIPVEKRKKLFAKFQESLDSLHQGTGIGLCLCLNLMELMGGAISLDEDYDSGVEGFPGSRFVIRLDCQPLQMDDSSIMMGKHQDGGGEDAPLLRNGDTKEEEFNLPESLSVLFVDDDMVLRKLFSRAVRKISPEWSLQEAANGETALKMVESGENHFDLMFVDQYMASVEKQLLGTETVRAMRVMGITAKICGLSANDVEHAFEDAGANTFMFKPFPTKPDALKRELFRILNPDQGTDYVEGQVKVRFQPAVEL